MISATAEFQLVPVASNLVCRSLQGRVSMSAIFFGVTDRFFSYSHAIGRAEVRGYGFRPRHRRRSPVDVALGAGDVMYVVNRCSETRRDGIRITKCTFGEDYLAEFGTKDSGSTARVTANSFGPLP